MINKDNEVILTEYIFYFNKLEDQWIAKIEHDGIILADVQQPSLDMMINTLKEYTNQEDDNNDDNT